MICFAMLAKAGKVPRQCQLCTLPGSSVRFVQLEFISFLIELLKGRSF